MVKRAWFAGLVVAVLVAGCAGGKPRADLAGFPEDAPVWLRDPAGDTRFKGMITQYGSYPKTQAGFDFQRSQALLSARANLAATLGPEVNGVVDRMTSASGAGTGQDSVSREANRLVREITDRTVMGARQLDLWIHPGSGEVYALVGADRKAVEEALRQETAAVSRRPAAKGRLENLFDRGGSAR